MENTYIQTREDLVRKMRTERGYGENVTAGKEHFPLRLCIAALLFLLYFAGAELSLSYRGIGSEQIAEVIEKNQDIRILQEQVQSVFKQIQ